MQGNIKTDLGSVSISSDVIAQYAGVSAIECFGIVGMASVGVKDGLVTLLKGRNNLTRGVRVNINGDNSVDIEFSIIVAYEVNINTIAKNLVENVSYKVKELTGMDIRKITIYVEGVRDTLD